jgi:hypothetical protein
MPLLAAFLIAAPAHAERIKDLGQFQGLRTNQLTGYGVVVGLAGTGDDSLDYSTLGVRGAVSRFGLNLPQGVNPALKNAAAVMVTAELPPFAKPGQRLDITVSAIGKAKSLRGGTLVLAPLLGAKAARRSNGRSIPGLRHNPISPSISPISILPIPSGFPTPSIGPSVPAAPARLTGRRSASRRPSARKPGWR